jgi:microfibrillar-associated protein 1
MTANPLQPVRHRAGKPVAPTEESFSSEEDFDDEEDAPPPRDDAPTTKPKLKPAPPAAAPPPPSQPAKPTATLSTGLKNVDLARDGASGAPLSDARRKAIEEEFETESSEGSEDDDDGSGSDEESSEEESSSSDDAARRRKLLRPVFMKKTTDGRRAAPAANEPSEEQKWAEEAAREQAKKDAAIQAQAQQYALERAEEKTQWDDDERAIAAEVDDADGADPEAERTAWKLRELRRLRRERDALIAREREREEVERRRNMTAEEREEEDAERAAAQREEREGKGRMGFRQKYFHKGAFFVDEAAEAGLRDRDVMGGRYADDVADKSALPEFMQIRDMARLGRKGRTRYKDLKTEDTGRFGDAGAFGRGGPREDRGVDERFRADYGAGRGEGATGANASALGERKRVGSAERREVKRSKVES